MKERKYTSSQFISSSFLPDLTISNSLPNSRRKFLKSSASAFSLTALKTTGIGAAANFLMSGEAHAYSLREDMRYYYKNFDVPLGAKKPLCQDQILCEAYMYLMHKGFGWDSMWTVLTGDNQTVDDFTIDFESWYCEPLTYVTYSTYKWKTGDTLRFKPGQVEALERVFYHNFALMKGIDKFYDWHVRRNKHTPNPEIERWLVHNIFAAAEEYPERGKIKAEEYLRGDNATRVYLITKLSEIYSKMSWSESDKQQRNVFKDKGELGPLNNWYRLLSAQWGAFFLSCHYEKVGFKTKNNSWYQFAKNIDNVEEKTATKIGSICGPPYYFDFKGNKKY